MRDYWRRASRRALADTLDFLGLTVRSRLQFTGALLSYVLALLLFLWIAGRGQMVAELQWGIAIVGALVLIFAPVFLANLVAAPVRLEREATKDRRHLLEILRAKSSHKEKLEQHAKLAREGVELVASTFGAGDLSLQRTLIEDWKLRAGEFIDTHAEPSERVQFEAQFLHGQPSVSYGGATYSGDNAVLGHGVDCASNFFNHLYIQEDYYSDFLTEQWRKELTGE